MCYYYFQLEKDAFAKNKDLLAREKQVDIERKKVKDELEEVTEEKERLLGLDNELKARAVELDDREELTRLGEEALR